ncbi:hypothetical protein L6452_23881 [Arctium lappa]|uniref:Uncharacterized protein n=1 Tax=Arctium lappa TaxID=4217 RepID=A0ACB9A8J8_ARCLA|nr:hypothetical protein L6452_23881 [Arctium lappa]
MHLCWCQGHSSDQFHPIPEVQSLWLQRNGILADKAIYGNLVPRTVNASNLDDDTGWFIEFVHGFLG